MGCSYDPMPVESFPTPAEQWMIDNHFSEIRNSGMGISYCHECGQILAGTRYGLKYLNLHVKICPISPRGEVPMKTETELKTDEYKRVSYR